MTKIKRNRLLCLFLCLIFTFTNLSLVQAFAAGNDTKGSFAENQINKWIEKGYVATYKDGSFKPNAGITRADFAKIINKVYGLTAKGKSNFKDVKTKDVFYKDMAIAKNAKYLIAKKNGTIKPKGVMNRQEFAYAVYKVMGLAKPEKTAIVDAYTDGKLITANNRFAVEALANSGLMSGNADNSFRPNSMVTRAEAIVILDKCLSFNRVSYDQAGTYSGKTVKGSATVNVTGVTLENTIIRGDLKIDKAVADGIVNLNNVTVFGDTLINGGGINSIHLKNCKLSKVIVSKENNSIRVIAEGTTSIKSTVMQSGGKLEENSLTGSGFIKVNVINTISSGAVITLLGNYDSLDVNGSKADISISENGIIKIVNISKTAESTKMKLEAGSRITTLKLNSASVIEGKGTIDVAEVNSQGSSISSTIGKIIKPGDVSIATPTPTPPPSNDATLKITSLIKGQTVTNLGGPSSSLESVVSGAIILPYDKAINTTNLPTFITSFDKNEAGATVKVVKYDRASVSTNFLGDAPYGNQIINDQDYFVIGVTAADKTSKLYYKIVVTVKPVQITKFDDIPNIQAGMVGNAKYGSSSSVTAVLPTTVKAMGGTVIIPVKSWTNTDSYNSSKVGSYTFTAVLGALPIGYTNENALTARVEVVVAPSGEIYSNTTIQYMDMNPVVNIILQKDTFDSSNTTSSKSYWDVSVGTTGLIWSAVSAGGTTATFSFTGAAKEGTITIQAKSTILMGGVQTNTVKLAIPGPTKIWVFDKMPDVLAGVAGNANYINSTAVIAALPKTVTANAGFVTIPVNTWQNTDWYNPNVAGSYTFTAALGTIPPKYVNYYGYNSTIEVVVSPPGSLSCLYTIPNGVLNPTIQINSTNDTFADACSNIGNWNFSMGSTKLTATTVTRTGANSVTIGFNGNASSGTISVQAKGPAMVGGAQTNAINVKVLDPTAISSFNTIPNIMSGIAGNTAYPNADAVIRILPTMVSASPNGISVPVTTWSNTDSYNPSAVGSYTFTAVLGTIPTGYTNSNGRTASVEVVVTPAGVISIGAVIPNSTINPSLQVNVINDTFSSGGAANPENWSINTGSTGLTVGSIVANGSSATIMFTGTANTGTISVKANPGALTGGVGTNTVNANVQAPIAIYGFDNIPDRSAGTVGNVIYADAAAVTAALPSNVTANGGVISVPVTGWENLDNYNSAVAGTYSFRAILGAIPAGYSNTGKTATVKVVVNPAAPRK